MSLCLRQVHRALLPSLGGNPAASFDEVVARMARAKVASFTRHMSKEKGWQDGLFSACSCSAGTS